MAINCLFRHGGVSPLDTDLLDIVPDKTSAMSLYEYYNSSTRYCFTWNTDVDAVRAPHLSDSYNRVYYSEGGVFKVTDKNLFNSGGTDYPMTSRLPSPLAPTATPAAVGPTPSPVSALDISDSSCVEADGTYALIFSGGEGSGATGTYTIVSNIITAVAVTAGGSGYTSAPTAETQSGNGTVTATILDATLVETRGYVYTLVNGYGQEGPPSLVSNLIDVFDGDSVSVTGMDVSAAASYWITAKRIYRINQGVSGAEYQFVAEIAIATASYVDTILDADLGEVLASTEWDGPPAGISGIISLPNGVLAGFVDNLLCLSVPYYPHAWPASYQKAVDRDIVAIGAFGTTVVVLTEGQPYLAIGNDPSNVVMERMDLGFSCLSKRGRVQAGEVVVYPCPEGLAGVGPGVSGILTADYIDGDRWVQKYQPSTIHAYYWQGKYVGFYGGTGGFIFDLKTGDLVDLDFYATSGFYDKTDGTLYLLVDGEIVKFTGGSSSREIEYLSKQFRFPPTCFGWAKVLSDTYPVKLDVVYRGIPYTVVNTVESDEPVRLPTFLIDACEIRVLGASRVSAVLLASTLEEFHV